MSEQYSVMGQRLWVKEVRKPRKQFTHSRGGAKNVDSRPSPRAVIERCFEVLRKRIWEANDTA